jgi:phosphatidylserine/phosphatidylglycerophosphate/cardiolipin synthase-like enzyme
MKSEVIIGKHFPQKVTVLIDNAKKSIKTVVYDWRWYPNDPGNAVQLFNQSVLRAVRRGVKVEAVVNNENILSVLNDNGVVAKKILTPGLVHAKLMIIDDTIVVIGSHNYTHNAFVLNQEISVALTECDDVSGFNLFFQSLWQS